MARKKKRPVFWAYLFISMTASFGTLATLMVSGRQRDQKPQIDGNSYIRTTEKQLSTSEKENVTAVNETDSKETSKNDTCQPKHSLVFLKTHKTGSSSITTMLERFGYEKDLNFALPKRGHVFSQFVKFNASDVFQYGLTGKNDTAALPTFQMLSSHARYNRHEMAKAVPHAVYITILREPAAQLESAFGFFRMGKYFPNHRLEDVFDTDVKSFYNYTVQKPMGFLRNGQLFDLGLEQEAQNPDSIDAKIQSLSEELDLVLITEYFDESLVLLKRFLCWEAQDILYMSQLVRGNSTRRRLSPELVRKIHEWNYGDVKLYQLFNRTLWERIRDYGPDFGRDLEAFRKLKTETTNMCISNAILKVDVKNVSHYQIKRNAPKICKEMFRKDRYWVTPLRKSIDQKVNDFMKQFQA